jgi:proteic killer suppression protein
VIKSFNDTDTKLLWDTGKTRCIPASTRVAALKKLTVIHWATVLSDLSVPGGNRLEALKRDRKGQHSIRINDQYRICFVWRGTDAFNVEIVDYH